MQWNKLDDAMNRGGDVTGVLPAEPHMLDILQGFVHELRNAGLPVSMTENLDAITAAHERFVHGAPPQDDITIVVARGV